MAHSHHDHSHEHVRRLSSLNRAFIAGILLNSVFVAAEFTAGILSNSMGLLSDAGHNLSDVASLLLALLAFRLARFSVRCSTPSSCWSPSAPSSSRAFASCSIPNP